MGLIFILSLSFWGWAEMSTFIYVGSKLGGLITFLGVFVTAIMGISLLRNQGLSVIKRVRKDLANGHAPLASVADSISLAIGGVLMLIPGYLTDAIGILLFIPGLRTFTGVYFIKWITSTKRFSGFTNISDVAFQAEPNQHYKKDNKNHSYGFNEQNRYEEVFDDIIEGDFEERMSPKPELNENKADP